MTNPAFLYLFVFIIGLCIGSFLNVCIYRIPKGESIIFPRSRCTTCKTNISWYDNIPVFSWFILVGKCRNCKVPFSFKYPFIEITTALLFLSSWHFLSPVQAIIGMVFVSILITASFIDIDYLIIPDRFTVGGFILGCLFSVLAPSLHGYIGSDTYTMKALLSIIRALNGAFLGTGLLLWIALIADVIIKDESMGGADIKLMGCIGAFCGWKGAVFSIFGGAFLGSLVLVPLMLTKRLKSRDPESSHIVIPFGPWLSVGAIVYFIFMRDTVDSYFNIIRDF